MDDAALRDLLALGDSPLPSGLRLDRATQSDVARVLALRICARTKGTARQIRRQAYHSTETCEALAFSGNRRQRRAAAKAAAAHEKAAQA